MPRIRVHYACDRCGRTSTAEYFDYRYHETEAVQAPCDGCGFMTRHTPRSAERITEGQPYRRTWRQFHQHGFTRWQCSGCGAVKQSLEQPEPYDCAA